MIFGIPHKKIPNTGVPIMPERAVDLNLEIERIIAPANLSEIAYEAIKESLLKMALSRLPDEGRLDERELALRLGISRTPLREAIHRLVSEGFLKVVPRKGIYVVKKSTREIVEILIVRAALEGMAARLTTKYATEDDLRKMKEIFSPFDPATVKDHTLRYADANIRFHEMVLQISQCGKLIELASNLFDHIRWIRFRAAAFRERHGDTLLEHLKIIEAFEMRDADLAEKRMKTHIENLAHYVEEKGDDFLGTI